MGHMVIPLLRVKMVRMIWVIWCYHYEGSES